MWHAQHQPQQQQPQPQQHYLQQQQQQHLQLAMAPQQGRPIMMQQRHKQSLQLSSDEEDQGCSYQPHRLQPQPLMPQPQQQPHAMENVNTMEVVAHSSNPRAARNLAEKQRRDNLNSQITKMATLVPLVAKGFSRKRDKISILRLSAAHLRQAYTIGLAAVTEHFFPMVSKFIPKDQNFEEFIVHGLVGPDSFLIVMNTSGKVIYISKAIEQLLGHEQADLIGDSLYNYVYADDVDELKTGLMPDRKYLAQDTGDESTNSIDEVIYRPDYSKFQPHRRKFHVRMCARANSRREPIQYEYVQFFGSIKLARACEERETTREACATSNDIIFVGTGRLLKKRTLTELSLLEANKDEYFTRHLVDGRIIFCDHRISIVAGYMTDEVSGTSAFKFMHRDDVRWTMVALKHMYNQSQNFGSSCYRLITKTGEFIYLRTHGYLEYDEKTNSVASFICINTLISREEGEQLIAEMKKRYSATTTKAICNLLDLTVDSESECSNNAESSLEDENNLEDAICQLINDLPSPVITEDQRDIEGVMRNPQFVKAAIYSQRLPPATVQAHKIGINNIPTGSGKGEKNEKEKNGDSNARDGKGEATSEENTDDRLPRHEKKNGIKRGLLAEKRIPELEKPSRPPPSSSTDSISASETMLRSPSTSVSEPYIEPRRIEQTLEIPPISKNITTAFIETVTAPSSFNVQTNTFRNYIKREVKVESNLSQSRLKRPYEVKHEDIAPKKRSANTDLALELTSHDQSIPQIKSELELPSLDQVQPSALGTDIQEIQSNYQPFENITEVLPIPDSQFVDFSVESEQLFNIDNNQEIMKLLLPQPIKPEGPVGESIVPQYARNNVAAEKNDAGYANIQIADSLSSCSQFSDTCESTVLTPYNNYPPAQPGHTVQQQRLVELQLNVQHDIEVYDEE